LFPLKSFHALFIQGKKMKWYLFLLLIISSLNAFAIDFPQSPHAQITPGSLCDTPTEYRYPEHINYCERDVSSDLKNAIFEDYRKRIGYTLSIRNRADYKIDHFIPLCAGGSNKQNNLWPQHVTVFNTTDPMESLGCEKLKLGRITQKDLVALIRLAKLNLQEVPRVLQRLRSL